MDDDTARKIAADVTAIRSYLFMLLWLLAGAAIIAMVVLIGRLG